MKFYNPFLPHVVEFRNGTYAVRKLSIFWMGWCYKDLKTNKDYWWPIKSQFHDDCTTTSLEVLAQYVNPDYGTKL